MCEWKPKNNIRIRVDKASLISLGHSRQRCGNKEIVKVFSLGIIVSKKYSVERIESNEMLSHQTMRKKVE